MGKVITNKYAGACRICGEAIAAGEQVLWYKGWGIKHPGCNGEEKATGAVDRESIEEAPRSANGKCYIKISDYGKHGDAYKIGQGYQARLLRSAGWIETKRGTSYTYLRPPWGLKVTRPFKVEVARPDIELAITSLAAFSERVDLEYSPWIDCLRALEVYELGDGWSLAVEGQERDGGVDFYGRLRYDGTELYAYDKVIVGVTVPELHIKKEEPELKVSEGYMQIKWEPILPR